MNGNIEAVFEIRHLHFVNFLIYGEGGIARLDGINILDEDIQITLNKTHF
jgi:hypothetical protein